MESHATTIEASTNTPQRSVIGAPAMKWSSTLITIQATIKTPNVVTSPTLGEAPRTRDAHTSAPNRGRGRPLHEQTAFEGVDESAILLLNLPDIPLGIAHERCSPRGRSRERAEGIGGEAAPERWPACDVARSRRGPPLSAMGAAAPATPRRATKEPPASDRAARSRARPFCRPALNARRDSTRSRPRRGVIPCPLRSLRRCAASGGASSFPGGARETKG